MSLGEEWVGHQAQGLWATFFLAGEMFGVRVEHVQEVLEQQALTPVPLAPDYVAGLLNLRGQIVPAVDLRRRLRLAERRADEPCSFLVLRDKGGLLGLIVDDFGDVLELTTRGWIAPPGTLATSHRELVFGVFPIEGRLVLGLRMGILNRDTDGAEGAT